MHPGDPEVIASQEYIVCAGGLQVFSQPAPAKSSAATQDARLPQRNRERDSLPRFMLMRLSDRRLPRDPSLPNDLAFSGGAQAPSDLAPESGHPTRGR